MRCENRDLRRDVDVRPRRASTHAHPAPPIGPCVHLATAFRVLGGLWRRGGVGWSLGARAARKRPIRARFWDILSPTISGRSIHYVAPLSLASQSLPLPIQRVFARRQGVLDALRLFEVRLETGHLDMAATAVAKVQLPFAAITPNIAAGAAAASGVAPATGGACAPSSLTLHELFLPRHTLTRRRPIFAPPAPSIHRLFVVLLRAHAAQGAYALDGVCVGCLGICTRHGATSAAEIRAADRHKLVLSNAASSGPSLRRRPPLPLTKWLHRVLRAAP